MRLLLICLLHWPFPAPAQSPASLRVQPVFRDEKIALEQPLHLPGGDSLTLHTLRFYLGHFVFWKNGQVLRDERGVYHLIDLEDENSLVLPDSPAGFDSLAFDLGVDSLTTSAGAMGGDLDPTRGMFWTWQSGYINLKAEGAASMSPARNGGFAYHLGGYLPPFAAARTVRLGVGERAPAGKALVLRLDLAPFFSAADRVKKPNVMSPGPEALRLSEVLAQSFSIHAE